MHLSLTRTLPFDAPTAWFWLTNPDAMNRWSTASIALTEPGDQGRPDAAGTLRKVTLPGPGSTVLREVVQLADPPRRFVYRVVNSPPLTEHRGEILLTPTTEGTTVEWTIDAAFGTPGLGLAARVLLARELGRSLDALASLQGVAAPSTAPALHSPPLDDASTVARLADEASAILDAQRALAARLEADGDPKRWFARVYSEVTARQLEACGAGGPVEQGWVLRLIPVFHRYYVANLDAWTAGGRVEDHWRRAFSRMERPGRTREERQRQLFGGLLLGIRAHIEEDLPRALADVYLAHYADRCDFVRFRGDYLVMGDIFTTSSAAVTSTMPRSLLPWYARPLARRIVPRGWAESKQRSAFYNVPRRRAEAFSRGRRLAIWNATGGPDVALTEEA